LKLYRDALFETTILKIIICSINIKLFFFKLRDSEFILKNLKNLICI